MSHTTTVPGPLPDPTGSSRGGALRAVPWLVVAIIAIAGLAWAKWMPYADKTIGLLGSGVWDGTPLADKATGASSWWEAGWDFTLAYTKAVWKALAVALVLSAAIQAVLGPQRLARLVGGRAPADSRRGVLRAAVAGLPMMMCTCCTAPVTVGLRRAGTSVPASTAFWLTNPVLNPAVIAFLLLVGPWQWSAVRVVVGIALVAAAAALAGRLVRDRVAQPVPPAPAGGPAVAAVGPFAAPEADERKGSAIGRFFLELGRLCLTLIPEYALLVFAVGALTYATGFSLGDVHWGVLALLAFAVAAVLFVIPTGGEIPVLIALVAAGAGPWAQGIALMCLAAVSLPSLLMVGRALTWRIAALIAGLVLVAGFAAGALLAI